jgi:hypothetical protein
MNASPLPAYMTCPIIRESRLVSDLSMPVRDWDRYEEPAYKRNPGYVLHSRMRNRVPVVKVVALPMLLRRQAQ